MSAPTPAYLLDTGWVIRHLRGQKSYSDNIAALEPEGLAVSIITVAELYEGVSLAKDALRAAADLADLLTTLKVLPVDEDTCRMFGQISSTLRKKGHHPGDFDVMIAATARQHGLTVLTTDADDFKRFTSLKIITKP